MLSLNTFDKENNPYWTFDVQFDFIIKFTNNEGPRSVFSTPTPIYRVLGVGVAIGIGIDFLFLNCCSDNHRVDGTNGLNYKI